MTRFRKPQVGQQGKSDENWKQAAPPPVRQWFPETVLWRPEVITDDHGVARVHVDVADSITTWRLSASAISAAGQLGASQSSLRVFQPFFVDVDLPVSLTRGDEIALPIVVHNYLDKPQSVTVTVDDAPWFQRLDAAVKTIALGPSEVRSVAWRIRVRKVGEQHLQVTAQGSGVADAVKRAVSVVPDGRRVDRSSTDAVGNPSRSIRAAGRGDRGERPLDRQDLSVELQPGRRRARRHLSDAVRLFRADVVDDVPQRPGPRLSPPHEEERPAVEAKARRVHPSGLSAAAEFRGSRRRVRLVRQSARQPRPTAYGLMEFEHMARVHNVDPQLIERTRRWLLGQRNADGSWRPEGHGLARLTTMHGRRQTGPPGQHGRSGVGRLRRRSRAEQAGPTLEFLWSHRPANHRRSVHAGPGLQRALGVEPADKVPLSRRGSRLSNAKPTAASSVWWQQRPADSHDVLRSAVRAAASKRRPWPRWPCSRPRESPETSAVRSPG